VTGDATSTAIFLALKKVSAVAAIGRRKSKVPTIVDLEITRCFSFYSPKVEAAQSVATVNDSVNAADVSTGLGDNQMTIRWRPLRNVR
jgi:hypothetical protein